jgi:hypothetical protein
MRNCGALPTAWALTRLFDLRRIKSIKRTNAIRMQPLMSGRMILFIQFDAEVAAVE